MYKTNRERLGELLGYLTGAAFVGLALMVTWNFLSSFMNLPEMKFYVSFCAVLLVKWLAGLLKR